MQRWRCSTDADGIAQFNHDAVEKITIEHPSGKLDVELALETNRPEPRFHYAGVTRNARRLFEGRVLIPTSVWEGR